ncbi:MAG TPA: ribosomal RNA small subunit methyltransferase A [Clostridiales bacterium]|jgi:16S rRNA (adenine1518-N6/adenine1519-N6)-dimethyltransferase|nr:ribosomal RNA small subunit methyltransferase A [Clostridiales bacterium]
MNLTDITTIKSLLETANTGFKKSLGQNFLINPAVPKKIAASLKRDGENPLNVLEIGPGIGALTVELSAVSDTVAAVEIDGSLLPVLKKTLADCPNVKVINADILKTDIWRLAEEEFGGEFSVCANLPYYITSPILMYLLEGDIKPREIIIMVQKEVAQRLCASPGSPEYGALTAAAAWFGECERLFAVSAGNFLPKPKVDSEVIRITPFKSPPYRVSSGETLRRVIRGAFARRRKTLVNSITSEFPNMNKERFVKILTAMGLPADIRGERLSVEQFAEMTLYIDGVIPL